LSPQILLLERVIPPARKSVIRRSSTDVLPVPQREQRNPIYLLFDSQEKTAISRFTFDDRYKAAPLLLITLLTRDVAFVAVRAMFGGIIYSSIRMLG